MPERSPLERVANALGSLDYASDQAVQSDHDETVEAIARARTELRAAYRQLAPPENPPYFSPLFNGGRYTLEETASIYVDPDERWVVSYIVGYSEADEVCDHTEAAAAALEFLRAEDSDDRNWFVFDRQTSTLHLIEQGSFDPERAKHAAELQRGG